MDTRDKRASAVNISLPWRGILPLPDADMTVGDRIQVVCMYRGIVSEDPPEEGSSDNTGSVTRYGYRLSWDNF